MSATDESSHWPGPRTGIPTADSAVLVASLAKRVFCLFLHNAPTLDRGSEKPVSLSYGFIARGEEEGNSGDEEGEDGTEDGRKEFPASPAKKHAPLTIQHKRVKRGLGPRK